MNISFLNPSLLWALPLALGPLVIHLLFRRKPKTIEFSDLHFIKLAAEKVRTRTRLRKYLLLLVRTLILFLLVLSFAKPYYNSMTSAGNKDKNDQLSAVLLIDVSYSSGYYEGAARRLDLFKEKAKKIIGLLPQGSRAGVIAYSSRVEAATPVLSGDRKYLAGIIDGIKLSNGATDIACALGPAKKLMDVIPSSNRALIILSDMAAHGFRSGPGQAGDKTRVVFFEPSGGENAWIENAAVEYDPAVKGFRIDTEAKASYKAAPPSLSASYYAGDKRIGSDFLNRSGAEAYKSSYFTGDIRGDVFTGKAAITPDRLEADDAFYFVKKKPGEFKVWIIDGDPKFGGVSSESFFLKNALPQAEVISESGIAGTDFSLPGAVVLANVAGDAPKIDEFIRSGGGALVFLGSHTSENFAPGYLPAQIGSKFSGAESVKWVAAGHPLAESVDAGAFEWDKVIVEQGFVLMPKENATVLASLSSGRAFLVEGEHNGSRVALCASTASRGWNNLPGRTLYAPFIGGLLRYLANADFTEERTAFTVGETFRKKAPEGCEVLAPGGAMLRTSYDGTDIYFSETGEPGIYRVMKGSREISEFAVNLDVKSGEGDLTPVSKRALRDYFSNCTLLEVPRAGWEKFFISLISGKDATRAALAVLFLLLILEILLSNPRPKS